jgi:hypothetical protein
LKKILILILLLLNVNLIFSNIYYVDKDHLNANDSNDGSENFPFSAIQHGVNQLAAGDTLYVKKSIIPYFEPYRCPGMNNAGVTINLIGTNEEQIIISGYPGEMPVINQNLSSSYLLCTDSSTDYAEPKRLSGFYLNDAEFVTIKNFEITNTSGPGIYTAQDRETKNIIIENNYIHHLYGEDNLGGVRIDNCFECIVRNNIIHDTYDTRDLSGNIYSNEPYNLHSGIHGYKPKNSIIENNLIYNVARGIYQKTPNTELFNSNEVRNNIFFNISIVAYDIGVAGVGVPPAFNASFHHNIIYNSKMGVNSKLYETSNQSSGMFIYNNIFYNLYELVSINTQRNVYFYNNIVHTTNFLDFITVNPGVYGHTNEISYFDYNIYYNLANHWLLDRNGGYYHYNNLEEWQNATSLNPEGLLFNPDQNSIELDPLFVDSLDGNFNLKPESPAIGSGRYGGNLGVKSSFVGPNWSVIEHFIPQTVVCEANDGKMCWYIDPINGDDDLGNGSFNNAYKSLKNLMYYYNAAARPSTWQNLQPGDYIYLMGGVYNDTWHTGNPYSDEESIFVARGKHGNKTDRFTLKAYPGEKPIFSPTKQKIAIKIYQGSYWDIEGIEIRQNSYPYGIYLSELNQISVSNLLVHDVDGVDNNNDAGVYITSVTNVEVKNSILYDNYDRLGEDTNGVTTANSMNLVVFVSDNVSIYNNVFYQTKPITANNTGGCLKVKHANQRDGFTKIFNNTFQRCKFMAIGFGSNNTHIYNNLVIDSQSGILMIDHGGTTYQQNILIEKNTFHNSTISFVPTDKWNGPPRNITIRNNIIYDETQSYSLYNNILSIGTYSSDSLMNLTTPEMIIDNNCYYNPNTPIQFCYFCNNGITSRSQGDNYLFSDWQTSGYDINSYNINPLFDSNYLPQEASCEDKGYMPINIKQIPTKPLDLISDFQSINSISLSWSHSIDDNLLGYKIFRDGVEIGLAAGITYIDLNLNQGNDYFYFIQAYDMDGNKVDSDVVLFKTLVDKEDTSSSSTGGGSNSPVSKQIISNQPIKEVTLNENCVSSFEFLDSSNCVNGEKSLIRVDVASCVRDKNIILKCDENKSILENLFLNFKELSIKKLKTINKHYSANFSGEFYEGLILYEMPETDIFVVVDESSGDKYLGRVVDMQDGKVYVSIYAIDDSNINILFEDNITDDEFVWNKLWVGFGVVAFLLTVFVAGVYVQRLYPE